MTGTDRTALESWLAGRTVTRVNVRVYHHDPAEENVTFTFFSADNQIISVSGSINDIGDIARKFQNRTFFA